MRCDHARFLTQINRIRVNPGAVLAIEPQPAFDTIDAGAFDWVFKLISLLLGDYFAVPQQPDVTSHWKTRQQLLSFREFCFVSH